MNFTRRKKLKAKALEEENKALRGQVATTLCYLGQEMPMDMSAEYSLSHIIDQLSWIYRPLDK
jgi:hypothetical protein